MSIVNTMSSIDEMYNSLFVVDSTNTEADGGDASWQGCQLKKPGNIVQHFLGNGSCYGQIEGRNPTRVWLERVPIRFFSRKHIAVAKSPSTIGKTHFFRVTASLIPLRAKRAFLNFWRYSAAKGRDLSGSVSKPQKNPRAHFARAM